MHQRLKIQHNPVGKHPDRLPHPALTAGRSGRAEEPSDTQSGGFSRILRRFLLPLTAASISGVVFVTGLTFAAYQTSDPTAFISSLSVIALGLTSLAGGITAGRCNKERPVFGSFVSGCLLTAILFLTSRIDGDAQGLMPWLLRVAVIPFHMLGGFMTRPRKKHAGHTVGKHHPHRP